VLVLSSDHPVIEWLSSHAEVLTSHDLQLLPQLDFVQRSAVGNSGTQQ